MATNRAWTTVPIALAGVLGVCGIAFGAYVLDYNVRPSGLLIGGLSTPIGLLGLVVWRGRSGRERPRSTWPAPLHWVVVAASIFLVAVGTVGIIGGHDDSAFFVPLGLATLVLRWHQVRPVAPSMAD